MPAHSPIRLIVFDCDGTLVDSQATIVDCAQAAFRAEGLVAPSADAIRRIVGLSLVEAVHRAAGGPDLAAEQRSPSTTRRLPGDRRGPTSTSRCSPVRASCSTLCSRAASCWAWPPARPCAGCATCSTITAWSVLRHVADSRPAPEQAAPGDAAGGDGGDRSCRPRPCWSATPPTTS